jgi:hypothetical protein
MCNLFPSKNGFYTFKDGIKVLGVPFGSLVFTSSFLQDSLDKDVQHARTFLRLRDILVAFGVLSQCFAQRPSHLLQFPPFPSF